MDRYIDIERKIVIDLSALSSSLNPHTKQPVYECSPFKCHRYDNHSVIRHMDILKVTTTKVTVREADEVTGEEM